MVAIGGIADIVQHWHEMARSRMTQSDTSPPSIAAVRKGQFAQREIWNIGAVTAGPIRALCWPAYRFAPLFGFIGDELAEVGRRQGYWIAAQFSEFPLDR